MNHCPPYNFVGCCPLGCRTPASLSLHPGITVAVVIGLLVAKAVDLALGLGLGVGRSPR